MIFKDLVLWLCVQEINDTSIPTTDNVKIVFHKVPQVNVQAHSRDAQRQTMQ